MNAEKKIIVGKTLKAKKCSENPSPNTNEEPALTESSIRLNAKSIASKTRLPYVVCRMSAANANCSNNPPKIIRGLIRRLCELISQARPMKTRMPRTLIRRCMTSTKARCSTDVLVRVTNRNRRTEIVRPQVSLVPSYALSCTVLKIRSPASPKPGTMNLRSFKSGSIWQT